MIVTEHLDVDLVAAYLDGSLTKHERETIEEHLSACHECCQEVAALDETLRSLPRGGSVVRIPWVRYGVPAVAAAAILAFVLIARPWLDGTPQTGVEPLGIERAPDVTTSRIEALSPPPSAVVQPESLVLAWRSAGEGARYQVTITTAAGDSVWGAMTADTNAAVPAESVQPDHEYLWYVDALLPDGRTLSTGISHFRTAP